LWRYATKNAVLAMAAEKWLDTAEDAHLPSSPVNSQFTRENERGSSQKAVMQRTSA
jgi:hypothetical protein